MKKQLRIVGYCRVSGDEQAKKGISMEEQADRLSSWARAMGHSIVGMCRDPGVKGCVPPMARDGFKSANVLLRCAVADSLAIIDLTRISRSVRDVLSLVEEFESHQWKLISLRESLDTSTPVGRCIVTVLAAISQLEREQTGERVRNAINYLMRSGRQYNGKAPFGWRAERRGEGEDALKFLVEEPQEQAILKRMLELRDWGASTRKIADALGINPRTQRPFVYGNVQAIMTHYDARRIRLAALEKIDPVAPMWRIATT